MLVLTVIVGWIALALVLGLVLGALLRRQSRYYGHVR
jgi:hypothetical protein